MDSLDQEIINVLRADGRIAFADIAKKLGVSPGIVQSRYNKMKKTGVIKGSTLLLDIEKLGIAFNASIGIEAVDSELEEVKAYVNGLKIDEAEIFSWITFGRFNIAVAIFSKNLLQAHRIMQLIKQHPSVLKVSISLSNINPDDMPFIERCSCPKLNKPQATGPLDDIDTKMLQILCKDARTPFNKIAKSLGIGTQTAFRRYRQLQQKGVISGSTIILSTKACGIKGTCGLYVKLKPGASVSIVKTKIACIKQPLFIRPKWGEYDFYIELFYADFQEVTDLIADLRKLKEILAIETMMYMLDDWSMPFILTFECGLPEWAFSSKSGK